MQQTRPHPALEQPSCCSPLLSVAPPPPVPLLQAAMLGARVLKEFVVQQIESIIDEDKSMKHSKLAEMVEENILDPTKVGPAALRGRPWAPLQAGARTPAHLGTT